MLSVWVCDLAHRDRFRRSVESYASSNGIPWVKFGKDDRKIDVMQPRTTDPGPIRFLRPAPQR